MMSNMHQIYQSNRLMPYHSAPSSMLANLDNADKDLDITGASHPFLQAEDTEFSWFLDDHLSNTANNPSVGSMSLPVSPGCDSQTSFSLDRNDNRDHANTAQLHGLTKEGFILEEFQTGFSTNIPTNIGPSSSILAHDLIKTHVTVPYGSAPMKPYAYVEMGERNTSASHHLISTSSAAMDVTSLSVPLDVTATFNHVMNSANTEADRRGVPQFQSTYKLQPSIDRQGGLLRQNSSPADLISDSWSIDVKLPSTTGKKVLSTGNSSEVEEKICGGATFGSAQRMKCGQDFCNMDRGQSSESTSAIRDASYYAELCSNKLKSNEVLCRVRAKRGCATNPRSIAERVRKTKINEGIRKLQDLVPNSNKLTNTVTVLDEAVEYVKYLQRQVQELSACRLHCTGQCHSPKSNIDVEDEATVCK